MINVGIIGCGFIGTALKIWLEENNKDVKLFISDPPKGINDDISDCDAYFVQIHLPTEDNGTQNIDIMKDIIKTLPKKSPIWIRTTILPGTSDKLSKETGNIVYHIPEFLTERTYIEDFKRQPMIFTGENEHIELLKKIFPNKQYYVMTSHEAEMAKYAHNVFGALKVTYFNCIYDLCCKNGLRYSKVKDGFLLSSYINAPHTQIPGPDGKLGYGGKCFPKDVNAFCEYNKSHEIFNILSVVKELNDHFRNT